MGEEGSSREAIPDGDRVSFREGEGEIHCQRNTIIGRASLLFFFYLIFNCICGDSEFFFLKDMEKRLRANEQLLERIARARERQEDMMNEPEKEKENPMEKL